jgi:S-adenosylmethionine:tRNA ribosyltransferase-isomerase
MPRIEEFDYELPPGRIAQQPAEQRDASRLLVLHRSTGQIEHQTFTDMLNYLRPGDIVVANDSRVIPARLFGRKRKGGGRVEILLLEELSARRWLALVGGKRLREGVTVELDYPDGRPAGIVAKIDRELEGSQREIEFDEPLTASLEKLGHTPLPPYIHQKLKDPERYQTVYAHYRGSSAAPTAGLHFTPELLLKMRQKGILFETITLHVGLDTFKPVDVKHVEDHAIHSEWARLTPEVARRINDAKLAGGRLVAVGTTSVRVLETAALRSAGITGSLTDMSHQDEMGETLDICPWRPVAAFEGRTDLFIYPGYRYRAVDALITNFHLPRSTLLMLVSAFAGKDRILKAYQGAIQENYRFYSFGDAMLLL